MGQLSKSLLLIETNVWKTNVVQFKILLWIPDFICIKVLKY